jgi:hypothetical protein
MQIWLGTSSGISRRSWRIRDAIHERDHEVEPGLEHRVEAPEPLDDPRVLLRDHANRLDDDDDGDDEECGGYDRRACPHGVMLSRYSIR